MNFLECSHHYCFVRVIDDVPADNYVERFLLQETNGGILPN